MTLGDQMAQIAPMRGIAVILEVLPARGIGQSVLELLLQRYLGVCDRLALQTVDWIRQALQDTADGRLGVVAGRDGAAGFLDCLDCGGTGARHDDVDGGAEGDGAAGKQLHTIFDAVHAAGFGELFYGDGGVGVKAAGVDPVLDAV